MKTGRNDPCPCGSGKKFKKCCLVKQNEPPPTKLLTLAERTGILYNAMLDIFQFSKAKGWSDIKKSVTEDRIQEFYKLIAWLWPPDTKVEEILPSPDTKLRALYVGRYRPELILQSVVRYTLYADEILVVLPFLNPWCVRGKYNPIENPKQFREDTLKSIALIHQLGPWVAAGLVRLIPDPGDFDYSLRIKTWEMAKNRVGERKLEKEDLKDDMKLAKNDFASTFYRLPKEALIRMFKGYDPKANDQQIEALLEYVDRKRKSDPYIIDEDLIPNEGQLQINRTGANLEMGLYISQLTGAYLYTDMKLRWKEILSVASTSSESSELNLWSPLTNAFQQLEFKFLSNLDTKFACELRSEGRLESLRCFLRKIWVSINKETSSSNINSLARDFSDELKDECQKAETEWKKIDQDIVKWVLGTSGIATMLTGGMQWEIPALGFCITSVGKLLEAKFSRNRFKSSMPMSVFLDLKKHK